MGNTQAAAHSQTKILTDRYRATVGVGVTDEEFDALYHAAFPRLVSAIYAMIGDVSEAQDAVQEAFISAWDHRRQLDASHSSGQGPEAWVRTVAFRLAVSRWRRAKRGLTLLTQFRTEDSTPEPQIHHVALVSALKHLPEAQRRVIVLHHLCDVPIDHIAKETGQAVGTVKAQLSRGRTALRSHLTEEPEQTTQTDLLADTTEGRRS